jgi:hypothetical protein
MEHTYRCGWVYVRHCRLIGDNFARRWRLRPAGRRHVKAAACLPRATLLAIADSLVAAAWSQVGGATFERIVRPYSSRPVGDIREEGAQCLTCPAAADVIGNYGSASRGRSVCAAFDGDRVCCMYTVYPRMGISGLDMNFGGLMINY